MSILTYNLVLWQKVKSKCVFIVQKMSLIKFTNSREHETLKRKFSVNKYNKIIFITPKTIKL